MEANVKVTAFLTNPEGVWQDQHKVEFPTTAYRKAAMLKLLSGMLMVGLIRTISENEVEIIPASRVKNIVGKMDEEEVVHIADNADLAAAVAATKKPSGLVKL